MTKRYLIVASNKGGTGKSFVSRAIANRLRSDEVDALLVDGDGEVGQLLQFHGDRDTDGRLSKQSPDTGVLPFSMKGSVTDRDIFINTLAYERQVVLADLPAGSITFLEQLEREVGLFDLLETHGYRATLINVITPYRASLRTVSEMIELAGDRADYVVVENAWFGTTDDYVLWHGDAHTPVSNGKRLLEQYNGSYITIPKLEGRTSALIDSNNLRFSDAIEDKRLTIADRSRVYRWLKTMDEEMNKIDTLLGITQSTTTA